MDTIPAKICPRTSARIWVTIAAGISLAGPLPALAADELARISNEAGQQDISPQDSTYEPTRISLRDPNFGFNFIAFLPKFEKKQLSQKNPPSTVALQDKLWTAIGEDRLDESRGGFDAGNGLIMSFGIERAVYINGNLVTTTSFNVSDVGKITSDQMKTLSAQAAAMGLVQNGPGNTFQLTTGTPGSVIQNTLNDQTIKSMTVINATSNSLNMIKSLNTQGTLNDAINNSLGRH